MSESKLRFRALFVGLLGLLASCTATDEVRRPAMPDMLVTVSRGVIASPDSVMPGWTRLRVEETDDGHIVVAFRLPPATTNEEASAFVAAFDTASATPHPGVAIGGPEVGNQGEVILHLTPGLYMLACVSRVDNAHRHAGRGESRLLHVRAAGTSSAHSSTTPVSTQTVRLLDFAYGGPDQWASGAQLLRVENAGKQDHQMRLARLRDGATLQEWTSADDPESVATTIAGMARVGANEVAYLPVDLRAGTYVLYCLVPDGPTHRAHVELGMLRTINVR